MIPRAHRLKHKKDFDILFKEGKFVRGKFVSLKVWRVDTKKYPRYVNYVDTLIGFVVGKKVHKSAVQRNLIKRRLRASVQQLLKQHPLKPSYVVSIVAFPPAHGVTYQELYEDVDRLFSRAKHWV